MTSNPISDELELNSSILNSLEPYPKRLKCDPNVLLESIFIRGTDGQYFTKRITSPRISSNIILAFEIPKHPTASKCILN